MCVLLNWPWRRRRNDIEKEVERGKIVEEFRCVLVCDENKIGIGEREEEK